LQEHVTAPTGTHSKNFAEKKMLRSERRCLNSDV
jgi:hypothetical protein